MERYWITGVSRGIGAALARELANAEREIIGLSRTVDPGLAAELTAAGAVFRHLPVDLTDIRSVRHQQDDIFAPPGSASRLCIINNAGMIGALAPVGGLGTSVEETVGLNSIALFVLCDLFAAAYQDFPLEKFIVNITSGAAREAKASMSLYCATKASVDMFTSAMGIEQESRPHPIQVQAVSPGMVETGMQETMRGKTVEEVPWSDLFREAKRSGKVQAPEDAAARIVRNIFEPRENGAMLRIHDLE